MMKIKYCAIIFIFLFTELKGQSLGEGSEINVQNNDDFTGFEMLDSAILNARVVMTGENHTYVKFNSKMELKMLRYLNSKVGTKNFVIELGPARAHFLNRYINESDTMADRYLRATTSPRYMDLFKRMKKFNHSLPDSLKITVYGIDVERFNDLPLIRLSELLPRDQAPKSIRMGVDAIHGATDYLVEDGLKDYELARNESGDYSDYSYTPQPFYISSTIYEFLKYYDSLRPEFNNWLGSKMNEINEAIGWLREYKQWEDYENTTYQYIWREEHIYLHISQLLKTQPGERFYGQFGRCHVAYEEQNGDCGWYGYHSVINKLQKRYFHSKDSLITLGLFYSSNGDNNYYSDREDDESLQKEIDFLLENTHKKAITLFHLEDETTELPRLTNKFSYAIVNDDVDTEDEDSADSDVIPAEAYNSGEFESHYYFGGGYTFSTVNTDILGKHVTDNGFAADLTPYGLQTLNAGLNTGRISQELSLGYMPFRKIHEDDSGLLRYQSVQANYRLGYSLIRSKRFVLSFGGTLGYATEKIDLENLKTSFLQAHRVKEFVHRTFVAGPSVKLQVGFAKYLYLGFRAEQMFDLSYGQWWYKGSSQTYGQAWKVTSGFNGFYFSGTVGFKIPVYPEYSYDEY